MQYLSNMPNDVIHHYGLTKTLFTRRETIYLKHVLKNVFIYRDEDWLNEKLKSLQFKSQFQYFQYVTNKLRGIYKLPRECKTDNADSIVKENRQNFFRTIRLYKSLHPLIILDFDSTITNRKFHALYHYLLEIGAEICINSANPDIHAIKQYLKKHNLPIPKKIYANKGKQKKIVRLKEIATKHFNRIIFFIDDEPEYLEYGCLLFMYCYEYDRKGKIHNRTFFLK